MKSQKVGLSVASAVFMLVALAHAARLVYPVPVMIGGHPFGRMVSLVAAVVALALSVWLAMLAGCGRKKEEAPAQPKA
jgi:uncharacterized membrane protein